MTFAEKVKFVRGKLQLSQIELAKQLNVSNVTINRWEVRGIHPSFLAEQRFEAFCQKNGIQIVQAKND